MCSFQASKLNYTSYFNSQGIWFQFERLYVWMIMSFRPKEDLNMEKDFLLLNLRQSGSQLGGRVQPKLTEKLK